MKKDTKKRGDSKTVLMELGDELVWDTWKAQLLVKIDKVLKPKKISFNNYDITFSIPRVHPKPTMLSDEGSYKFMVSQASKGKDPNVLVTVEPIIPDKVCTFQSFHYLC